MFMRLRLLKMKATLSCTFPLGLACLSAAAPAFSLALSSVSMLVVLAMEGRPPTVVAVGRTIVLEVLVVLVTVVVVLAVVICAAVVTDGPAPTTPPVATTELPPPTAPAPTRPPMDTAGGPPPTPPEEEPLWFSMAMRMCSGRTSPGKT